MTREHPVTGQHPESVAAYFDDAPTTPGGAAAHLVDRRPAVGGARPTGIPRTAHGSGLHAGPPDDPDRFELTGPGLLGGEGVTWRARYAGELGNPLPLAVKQLNRPPGAGPGWPSPAQLQRWQDHRVLLQSLRAPHLVPVTDVFLGPTPHPAGETPGSVVPFVVMPWVPGPSLAQHLVGAPATRRSLTERLGLARDLAEALEALHSATATQGNPLVHRDVKPSNCIIDPAHGLTLVDLGTLRLAADGADETGMHTPGYAAPEVVRDPRAPRQPASEVYSLGAVTLFCLTGQDPPSTWDGEYLDDARRQVLSVAAAAGVPDPAAFAGHVLEALALDPERRPTAPLSWIVELMHLATSPPPSRQAQREPWWRRRVAPIAVAVALAVVVVVALVVMSLRDPGASIAGSGGASTTQPVTGPGATAVSATTAMSTPTAPPPGGTTSAGRGVTRGIVTLDRPADGANVHQCQTFRGHAALPPGTTLVTAVRNVSNGDPLYYVQTVDHWQQPQTLTAWSGTQYFGSGDDSVGQDYLLLVLAASLDRVRGSHDHATTNWVFQQVPAGWTVVASIQPLHRVSGPGTC